MHKTTDRPVDVTQRFSERVLLNWLGSHNKREDAEQGMLHDFMLATRHLGQETNNTRDEHSIHRGWHLDVNASNGKHYALMLHFVGLAERDETLGAYDSGTFHFRLQQGNGFLMTAESNRSHNVDEGHPTNAFTGISILEELEDLRPVHEAILAQQERVTALHKQRLADLRHK